MNNYMYTLRIKNKDWKNKKSGYKIYCNTVIFKRTVCCTYVHTYVHTYHKCNMYIHIYIPKYSSTLCICAFSSACHRSY